MYRRKRRKGNEGRIFSKIDESSGSQKEVCGAGVPRAIMENRDASADLAMHVLGSGKAQATVSAPDGK
jgi:hypothetical protein